VRWELALIVAMILVAAVIFAVNVTGMLSAKTTPVASDTNSVFQTPAQNNGNNQSVPTSSPGSLITGTTTTTSSSSSSGSNTTATSTTTTTNTTNRTTTTGGGGGSSSGGGGSSVTPRCPTCSGLSDWSSCQSGQQTRTNYKCDSTTNYQCQPITEQQACSITYSASIFVNPINTSVSRDGNFTVNIMINSSKEIYAVQFDVIFDSNIIERLSANESDFLKSDGVKTYPIIQNSNSSTTFADTRMVADSGVSGTGVVLTMTFHAKNTGTSTIALQNIVMTDTNINPVGVTSANGNVGVA